MSLFSVLLIGDNEEARKKISEKILSNYKEKALQVNDDYYIVSTNEAHARDVAKTVGIYSEPQKQNIPGMVFRLNGSYAGFASGKFWDWIEDQVKQVS